MARLLPVERSGAPLIGRLKGKVKFKGNLDLEIAVASTRLDFRSDPADEIIAATSLVHGAPLLTRDPRLLKSRLVPLA